MTKKIKKPHHLLQLFFSGKYDGWSSFKADAEILWVGQHYLLLRTGMSENRSRYVWLVDKDGLQYDEDAPALVQLAANIHPVQAERADLPELLHESNQKGGEETVFEGRWCKARKQQCIAYAKRADATYERDLPGWIAAYEQRAAERKALEKEERNFAARLVRHARKEAQKVGAKVKGETWDKGKYGDRHLCVEETLDSDITFRANSDNWKVTIFVRDTLELTESQFKRYIRLLCKFHHENKEQEKRAKCSSDDE